MKKKFDEITNSIIIVSCLLVVLGCVLIVYPTMSLRTLGIMSAIYLLAHGITLILLEVRLSKIFVPFENLISGVLSIVLSIVLLSRPEAASLLLTIVLGVWIIVSSINNIKVAIFFKKIKEFPSDLMILLGVLDIILGLFVIFNPFEAVISLTLYIGIMLIIHSIFNICDMIVLKKNVKNKENLLKEKLSKIIPNFDSLR